VSCLLSPFHGAIAVPSVTRCRCCRCRCRWRCHRGHRYAGGVRQRHLVNGRAAARSSEWAQHFSNASCFYFLLHCLITVYQHLPTLYTDRRIRHTLSGIATTCCAKWPHCLMIRHIIQRRDAERNGAGSDVKEPLHGCQCLCRLL